jgi:hypothetical protein
MAEDSWSKAVVIMSLKSNGLFLRPNLELIMVLT